MSPALIISSFLSHSINYFRPNSKNVFTFFFVLKPKDEDVAITRRALYGTVGISQLPDARFQIKGPGNFRLGKAMVFQRRKSEKIREAGKEGISDIKKSVPLIFDTWTRAVSNHLQSITFYFSLLAQSYRFAELEQFFFLINTASGVQHSGCKSTRYESWIFLSYTSVIVDWFFFSVDGDMCSTSELRFSR